MKRWDQELLAKFRWRTEVLDVQRMELASRTIIPFSLGAREPALVGVGTSFYRLRCNKARSRCSHYDSGMNRWLLIWWVRFIPSRLIIICSSRKLRRPPCPPSERFWLPRPIWQSKTSMNSRLLLAVVRTKARLGGFRGHQLALRTAIEHRLHHTSCSA